MNATLRLSIASWSDLPAFIDAYRRELLSPDGDGLGRIFGYASIIEDHRNEKPEASARLPNERATLHGQEVAMNLYAVGPHEYRGTTDRERGVYNVGIYAGLEPAPEGRAEGYSITTVPEDLDTSLYWYLLREIGKPPEGIELRDFFDPDKTEKVHESLARLSPEVSSFGQYVLQIVDVADERGQRRPAVTVAANPASPYAATGLPPLQAAHAVLDGQGYVRKEGKDVKGGEALSYFDRSVVGAAEKYGLHQLRLPETARAVDALLEVYAVAGGILSSGESLATRSERMNALLTGLQAEFPSMGGLYEDPATGRQFIGGGPASPLFPDGAMSASRPEPTPEEKAATPLPRSAEEKFDRWRTLHAQRAPRGGPAR